MTETFLKDQNYGVAADAERMSAEMMEFRPPAAIDKGNLTHRRPERMSSRRARPLTRIQEVLFIAAAFFVAGLTCISALCSLGDASGGCRT
ncbi:MAG: hypothetical protein L0210_14795 [Rhodospirillales bacterium]|nr:hypothetical protein [Rhodospirillales bacterium]